jgi:Raf kinase inhibitor-like YbhB/YbcL family protein
MSVSHQLAALAGRLLRPLRAGEEKLAEAKETGEVLMRVTSTSFVHDEPIPSRFAGEDGTAPALAWEGSPPQTKELVLLCEDPDAPFPKPFAHWVVIGLPSDARSLTEGVTSATPLPGLAMQGKNSAGGRGYTGPKPPPGHGVHHYHFQVFALGEPSGLQVDVDRDAVVAAIRGKIIASGELVGTYEVT